MKIGSLFSGYGGLEQGVQTVLGGTVAWHSEIDPGACKILAHRYPDVPNLGDITAVDWASVEPVDVLTGGFPCQDVSAAGKRRGLNSETRSGLWAQMARAIDELRPALVVAENVRGLLSAPAEHPAHGDLEPCPWCLGDDEPVTLRALGAVLGDLADLGYDARWYGLRAADVGAPHGRFRVFVVAWPADSSGDGLQGGRSAGAGAGWPAATGVGRRPADSGRPGTAADAERGGRDGRSGEFRPGRRAEPADGSGGVVPDAQGDGRHEGRPEPARLVGGPDAALGGGADPHAARLGRRAEGRDHRIRAAGLVTKPAAYPDGDGREVVERIQPRVGARPDAHGRGTVDWGPYGPAVRRWERVLDRPAPSPTEPGRNGAPRLSARFVEWLMGPPAGWVTDVPGISRNEALKALGNGVVPQQAAAALRLLLGDVRAAA